MKSLNTSLIVFASVGLLLLTACSNATEGSNSTSSPANSVAASPSQTQSSTPNTSTNETSAKSDHSQSSKGGQVVETGTYHLEFVPEKEANGTHLDFYLQKGDNHESVPNAKVTALVQLPDGTQKTLNLSYDAEGKHYAVLLPETAPGQYQVKMIADINGETVNGRFNFNK
ncbi:hypothetical protein H6S82_15265 [Planktothrix sp. FACHB-1355]|uniref:Lipoprotein n=1 Tax=Aerosakkonema funiforme FACHB-1375 TaxID=2949571 RepID=A0A926VIZ8_9CYAN|nr:MULTISPECIES: hypothetical protein [Oscillatoriales]MBD2183359.1 hypothetical protein [Aerosakkonema funiforme FACHB-1375]MBD3560202.1 hypothetical protein [Planktothrix sp. FACHB-1355]